MKPYFIYINIKILIISVFLSLASLSYSQDSLQYKSNFFTKMLFPDSTQLVRYRIVPVLNYSPETRLGFGAGAILNWDYKNAPEGTNSSWFQSFFMYTQNNQIDWTSKFQIFTNENKFFFAGSVGYIKFPQNYYGVGNDIEFSDRENFSFQQIYFDLKNRIRVSKKMYLGVDYYFNKNYDIQWIEGSKFESDTTLVGTSGYLISGIGPEVVFDTRDYPFNPTKGIFFSASVIFHSDIFGSEYSYNYYAVDYRQFFLINKKKRWVLGINVYGLFANGEVPFNRIPALGGIQIMRGYYSGRYRDNNYLAAQLEWRMPIWRFIGLAAWVGTGQVASNFNQFSWDGLKPNVGIGLRFLFDKKSKLTLRADQGFGTNSNGFYIRVNEAF